MTHTSKTEIPVNLPVVSDSATTMEYRQLDAKQIEDEMTRRARNVRRALRGYESAKAVSQETLDTPVCV